MVISRIYDSTDQKPRSDLQYNLTCRFILVNRTKTQYYELQSSETKGTRKVAQKYDGTQL